MTEETSKTLAELEAEARERVQQGGESKKPADDKKPAPQLQITSLKKRGKNRIMVACLLVFAVLVVLAFTGDHLLTSYLKNHKKEDPAPAQTERAAVKRSGMGMEANALGTEEREEETQPGQAATPLPPPLPVTFDKTAALAITSAGESSDSRQSSQSASNAPGEAQPTGYTPCPVLMVKDATGRLICPAGAQTAVPQPTLATVTEVSKLKLNPDLYIPVDTYIPCSLMNRFVSTVAGKISCVITEDVYSASRNTRLIPAGTKARGIYQTGTIKQGDARMLVAWTELRTPDGKIIPMVDSQVVGQLGENGIAGWVDNHTWERLYSTLLISMIPDVASAMADNAPGKDRNTDYTENTRSGVAEMAKSMMENSANIAPTIYKNQGEVIGISTGADIDFSSVYRLALK